MKDVVKRLTKQAKQCRSEASGLLKKAAKIEDLADKFADLMPEIQSQSNVTRKVARKKTAKKAKATKKVTKTNRQAAAANARQVKKKFPFGKPVSQGGLKTNAQIIESFLKRSKKGSVVQIAAGTGVPKGSVSYILCTSKSKFSSAGNGKWELK